MLLLDGLEPLDAYFAATGLWEKLLPGLEMTAQFRGVEYGVPGVALYPLDGLVWNKTMFAEGGIQPLPEDRSITWTELVELARKLVVRSADDNLVRIGYHPLEGRNSNPDVLETYFDLTLIADGEPRLNSAGSGPCPRLPERQLRFWAKPGRPKSFTRPCPPAGI